MSSSVAFPVFYDFISKFVEGNSKNSTSVHVHFEILRKRKPLRFSFIFSAICWLFALPFIGIDKKYLFRYVAFTLLSFFESSYFWTSKFFLENTQNSTASTSTNFSKCLLKAIESGWTQTKNNWNCNILFLNLLVCWREKWKRLMVLVFSVL